MDLNKPGHPPPATLMFSQLQPGINETTIVVRVTRAWKGVSTYDSTQMVANFILLDEEDSQVHAVAGGEEMDRIWPKLYVCGVLLKIEDMGPAANDTNKLQITIMDKSCISVPVILWGDQATLFGLQFNLHRKMNTVIILPGLRMKKRNGQTYFSSTPATQIHYNPIYEPLQNLHEVVKDTYGSIMCLKPPPIVPHNLSDHNQTISFVSISELRGAQDSLPQKVIVVPLAILSSAHIVLSMRAALLDSTGCTAEFIIQPREIAQLIGLSPMQLVCTTTTDQLPQTINGTPTKKVIDGIKGTKCSAEVEYYRDPVVENNGNFVIKTIIESSKLTRKRKADTAAIHVRVTRIWKSFNPNDKKLLHTNVILLDQEGNHIWAMVRNTQKTYIMKKLEEDGVYIISRVIMVSAPERFRSVNRDIAISFFHQTKFEKMDDTGIIPKYKFELQDFQTIGGLIGNVTSFIAFVIYHSDRRQETMTVSLWGDKGAEFLADLAKINDVPVFVVITGLLAKTYFGGLALSPGDGTKYYFNIDYAPLNDLKAAILAATNSTLDMLPAPRHKPLAKTVVPATVQATINAILEMTLPPGKEFVRCACKATITDIIQEQSCYKVSVTVEDDSGTTTFTLFNKDAELLIGIPLEKVISEMPEDHLMDDIPAVVHNIVGKVCDFEIKVTSYNIKHHVEDYTVARVTECPPITRGKEKLAEATTSSTKKRKTT
ncbi:hypothetical protein POM88_026404 [Heracleum sosnowskyi]|uniref:Replication protein A 70 kDa DNA-binding subunit B/D first OB fold domain-containing protein n=1 Tax=Heracleum sosnowskyi TaxID=360622 RepID=A0AAD8I920_9APIA|nr:hypothetical protein POM88_026404 [Heracleum sosnowskyi]